MHVCFIINTDLGPTFLSDRDKITRRDHWPLLPSSQSHPMVMATVTVGLHLRLSLPRSTQMRSATRGAVVNSCFTSPLLSQFALHPLTQPHLTFFSSYSLPHQHPRGIYSPLSSATEEGALIEEEELEEVEEDPTLEVRYLDPEAEAERITEWEVDFCSRPIFDERGKKIWELVVCDATLSLQFTRYFPNNVINSVTLKDAISDICSSLNVPLPFKIRFFRSQMQTIITKACNELGIKPIPSKRCISLQLWLEERYETVYSRHPGFQKGFKPLLSLDNPFAMKLPENLFGDKWAFVQLPFSAVQEEVSSIYKRYAFGQGLDLDLLGFEFDDNTLVPGLAVASTRAKALAAWMNGLEICAVEVDKNNANLILSVGVSTRYVYASYQKNAATTQEAEAWESAKKACSGLHFLAIQETLDSEGCVGFWLLLDLPPPPV